jgi:hypothetical protein
VRNRRLDAHLDRPAIAQRDKAIDADRTFSPASPPASTTSSTAAPAPASRSPSPDPLWLPAGVPLAATTAPLTHQIRRAHPCRCPCGHLPAVPRA